MFRNLRDAYRVPASGCSCRIYPWSLMGHSSVCEYRPTRCTETKTMNCRGKICMLQDFASHLISDHNCCNEVIRGTFVRPSIRVTFDKNRALPLGVLTFDGNTFLLHEVQNEAIVYRWITVIGGEKEAEKYNYFMKLSSNKKFGSVASDTHKYTWTLPVLPYHKFKKFRNVFASRNFVSIHSKTLLKICDIEAVDGGVKYSFKTHVTFATTNY